MKQKFVKDTGLFLLAAIFSTGLMFAFIELPSLLDRLMQHLFSTPQFDPGQDSFKIELFYEAYSIRLIGYICLAIILALIVIGFSTRKTGLAWLGGLVLFLPVFATFAYSMFYLAGLGLFNIVLFPALDSSLSLVNSGDIVLVPYWILRWLLGLAGIHNDTLLTYFFMILGSFIFILGVFSWLQTRFGSKKVAVSWLYKYSRHPQYLGWIIWSYGLMLYGPTVNDMKKSWGWTGTLPWLLSTMVIIGICMLEELKMKEKAGEEYEKYRDNTPFLFPLPKFINKILNAPLWLVFKKKRVERKREIGTVIGFYTLLLIGLSFFWVDFPGKKETAPGTLTTYEQSRADSLVYEIEKPQNRRDRSMKPFHELLSMGTESYPVLIELMNSEQPEVREFAMGAAAQHNVRDAIPYIFRALHDSVGINRRNAIRALGSMNVIEARDTLLYFLNNNIEGYRQDLLLEALANLGCVEILPRLEANLDHAPWYSWRATVGNIWKLDQTRAIKHLYEGLESEVPEIRREAVYMILETLPEDAEPQLQKVLNDDTWEVRFYAKQAIKLLHEKSK